MLSRVTDGMDPTFWPPARTRQDPRTGSIRDASTWPPGSMMLYKSQAHQGFGIVVANVKGRLAVLWDERCSHRLCVYDASQLNEAVISRVHDHPGW